ncbi:Retrovirus-related Pol polyprotein from transposon RE2 [Vitis vinifera]|uniref:Retrovirus-related Pol polyprotein from transposon RE2 n=1 Tax=Vitis vinifera TaxID=29760 RepID=A0A438INC1_VITVI|nr:Retrovirus-related Pol polyprotein from transposon RE2 [Vitis vinifera]
MATKSSIFSSIISGSPMITSEKLVSSENYLFWSASVELWFMSQGYEDHLVTQEADIPEVDRVQWRKIDTQLCSVLWQSVDPKILLHLQAYKTYFKFWNQTKGSYTNDIQRLYKVASSIVNVKQQDMDLSTYISQIASLKEEFLTVIPLTTDVGDQRIQIDKFFMVLTLIGLRPDLETIRDQILGSFSVPSLDDVFAHLLRISSTQTLSSDNTSNSSVLVSQTNSREGRSSNRVTWAASPHCHMAQSSDPQPPQPPSSSTSRVISLTDSEYDDYLRYQATKSAFVASVAQTGNVSAYLTHTSSLRPWILDSGASDHISGNKDLFSSITTTSALPTVTLTNGSQTMAKDRSTGKTIGIGRESQGLYHLTSPSTPADKLSAKATKCIFLGYSRLQKGYRCYSSKTHRYFLSANVTFFEDSPFFSTSESLPVSEVLPLPIISPPNAVSSRPLQVYHHHHHVAILPSLAEVPVDSLPIPSASPVPALPHSANLPIALRKGWQQAMVDEMAALHSNGTWDLVVLPSNKSTVGCRWVYTVKVGPDGQVDRLKARLVAKGYTRVYGSDYGDTFSPVAKIGSIRLLLSMADMRSWPLYQLDIKNVFLHGDLAKEVYMEQPPGFVAQGESGLVCRLRSSLYGLKQSPRAWFSHFSSIVQEFGMFRSIADHSIFYHHNSSGQCIYLVVYVDDIVITSSDQNGIQKLRQHLFTHFQTKGLGILKYFLGIEIAQSSSGVVLSQRKYALNILEETGMLDCKPVDTPMDPNVKLIPRQGEPLGDPRRYRRLVGKLNYLTITRPDISFPVSVVGQFLQSPCDSHWDVVIRILKYIKSTPGQGVLYENRGHTQSKKQDVVVKSSVEAKYRAMALATCELVWLKHLLRELRFGKDEQMKLICDNQAALHIASNPIFHEKTKHIEVDCHFIREKIASGCVATSFVNSNDQLADIFTKSLRGPRIKYICNKLGAYNIYAPA